MENEGVQPDVLVYPQPDQLSKGEDAQLVKAVEVLQATVAEWKKTHPSAVAVGPDAPKPQPPGPPIPPGPASAPPMFMPGAK